jgi:hypothetical protein
MKEEAVRKGSLFFVTKFYMVYLFVILSEAKYLDYEWRFVSEKRDSSLRSA